MANGCDPLIGGRDCWDISPCDWFIVSDHYVSSPTSLQLYKTTAQEPAFLCTYAPALYLLEGRISSWFRLSVNHDRLGFTFLNTADPGTANISNCYYMRPYTPAGAWDLHLREMSGGAIIRQWTKPIAQPAVTTWLRWRISWYISFGNLIVENHHWDGAAWQPLCANFSVPAPLHLGAAFQRPGICPVNLGNSRVWIDDTVITSLE